jgi:hypothetical protein
MSSSMEEGSSVVMQEQFLRRWINWELQKTSPLSDLAQDLQDGAILCSLLEVVR